jgi:flagellar M-ring protein FliF
MVDGDDAGRGVPGASNAPPNTSAPTKATAPDPGRRGGRRHASDAKANKPASTTQSERMINYEVDRNVEHGSSLGTIQRLTTAVVVNYRTVLKDGTPTTEPLSKEELDNINNLVRQAMGFTESRGDALVINSPFVSEDTSVTSSPGGKPRGLQLADQRLALSAGGLRRAAVVVAGAAPDAAPQRQPSGGCSPSAPPSRAPLLPTSTGTSVVVAGQERVAPHPAAQIGVV